MLEYVNGNKSAIIVLHEIYGINRHIEEVCKKYSEIGFDVFCPDLLNLERPFDYSEQEKAYCHFQRNVGFEVYGEINELIQRIRPNYKKIIFMGFSVGATIAWRCAEKGLCDAIVCCYGSRIRDYMEVTPLCPSLLIFAEHEKSFNTLELTESITNNVNTTAFVLNASHGFCDPHCPDYNGEAASAAESIIDSFLQKVISN